MTATYYTGDVLEVLAKLPEDSVDLVLTSPPFLALRSYLPADHPDKALEGGSQCTPGEFIDWLLDVVEACDRVLAPHGSMCIELGDTFAGSGGAGGDYGDGGLREGQPGFKAQRMASGAADDPAAERAAGVHEIKRDGHNGWSIRNMDHKQQGSGQGWPASKSLTLIPETFRFALAYGRNPHTGRTTTPWRIRNVIRWVRPNPPVGSLGDKFRPATSEMVVFCRTDEAGRRRYFDLDAVREPYSPNTNARTAKGVEQKDRQGKSADRDGNWDTLPERNNDGAGAPPLDWWEIPTHPYPGAHYATFPPQLCVKPIKAMCPERVCRTCGEPSRRVVEHTRILASDVAVLGAARSAAAQQGGPLVRKEDVDIQHQTLGWTSCDHDNDRPGVVLDPFGGSGTTGAVAVGHGRDAVLIDLDDRNVELARERIGPLFFEEGVL